MPSNTKNLRTLIRVVREFRVIDNDMPVSYAAILLFIAKHERDHSEPPAIGDISDALGIARPAMSRATQALSTRSLGHNPAPDPNAVKRKSLGVIERFPDIHDLRMVRCRLNDKGKALVHRLEELLED